MKAIVTVGVSASGKSTFAKKTLAEDPSFRRIERDLFRFAVLAEKGITQPENIWAHWDFKKYEDEVTIKYNEALDQFSKNKDNIICSDTNLNPKIRASLIEKLKSLGYEVEVVPLHVTYAEAVERDRLRQHSVGAQVLYKQWEQWIDFLVSIGEFSRAKQIPLRKEAVIFDIDGTLAQMTGRKPYDWHRVGEDKIREPVCDILDMYRDNRNYEVFIFSGRDSCCRKQTEDWLLEHELYYEDLLMREKGDNRPDYFVKYEMAQKLSETHNIYAVFDDRPSVVRLWHDLGVKNVFCVGNPWKEF